MIVTKGKVTTKYADPTYNFRGWFDENIKKVTDKFPGVKEKGMWIVTQTYSVKECGLTVLQSTKSKVSLSLSATVNAAGVAQGNAQAAAEWWHDTNDESWRKYRDVSSPLYGVRNTSAGHPTLMMRGLET